MHRSRFSAVILFVAMTAAAAHAATVRVHVARNGDKSPLDVRLGIRKETATPEWIAYRRLRERDEVAHFDGLAAGTYVVLVEGDEPLERTTTLAVVAAGDVRDVKIVPSRAIVVGQFTLSGKPLANADVTFSRNGPRRFRTDAKGEYRGVVWERGEYEVGVRTAKINAPFAGRVQIPDGPRPQFAFDMPDRSIRGRVVDEAGRAIAGTRVTMQSRSDLYATTRPATTAEDGTFRFDAVHAGSHTIYVLPQRHLRPDPVRFEMSEEDALREVEIAVTGGRRQSATVVDRRGAPQPHASIVCVTNASVRSTAESDDAGRVTFDTPLGEDSTLYVMPRDGGLVIRRLRAADSSELRIVVPPATASLEISALSPDGKAVTEVGLLMRFNGELIPPDVARELRFHQGIALITDDHGVARLPRILPGVYEFWPYRSEAEVDALLASSSVLAAPININVVTGDNKARVRFRKRR